jgi:hypothetical protein
MTVYVRVNAAFPEFGIQVKTKKESDRDRERESEIKGARDKKEMGERE